MPDFTKVQWVEDRKAELLPVPYFHLVFTVPTPSPPHPRAQETAVDTAIQRGESDARAVWTPQPRRADRVHHGSAYLGSDLGAHFHVHCIMAAGALAADGTRWIEADPRFLFPGRALSTVFRGKFCAALAQGGPTATRVEGSPGLGTPEDFEQLRAQLYTKDWVVYAWAPWQAPPVWTMSAAIPIASPLPTIGSSTCVMVRPLCLS